MRQRLEIPLEPDDVQAVMKGFIEGLTPKFFDLKSFRGVQAVYLNDTGDGLELAFELRGSSFPLARDARRGELFVVSVTKEGIRVRRETGRDQWFVTVSPDAELAWERGADDGYMTPAQRKQEFIFQPPTRRSSRP